jgi:hypothetical protein
LHYIEILAEKFVINTPNMMAFARYYKVQKEKWERRGAGVLSGGRRGFVVEAGIRL